MGHLGQLKVAQDKPSDVIRTLVSSTAMFTSRGAFLMFSFCTAQCIQVHGKKSIVSTEREGHAPHLIPNGMPETEVELKAAPGLRFMLATVKRIHKKMITFDTSQPPYPRCHAHGSLLHRDLYPESPRQAGRQITDSLYSRLTHGSRFPLCLKGTKIQLPPPFHSCGSRKVYRA